MCFLIELFNLKAIKTCNSCRRGHILTKRVQDYRKVIERLESSRNFGFNVSLAYEPQKIVCVTRTAWPVINNNIIITNESWGSCDR